MRGVPFSECGVCNGKNQYLFRNHGLNLLTKPISREWTGRRARTPLRASPLPVRSRRRRRAFRSGPSPSPAGDFPRRVGILHDGLGHEGRIPISSHHGGCSLEDRQRPVFVTAAAD